MDSEELGGCTGTPRLYEVRLTSENPAALTVHLTDVQLDTKVRD